MGFFKEFKDDFSEAVDELIPGGQLVTDEIDTQQNVTNTIEDEIDVDHELSKLDGLLEQVTEKMSENPMKTKDYEDDYVDTFSEAKLDKKAKTSASIDTVSTDINNTMNQVKNSILEDKMDTNEINTNTMADAKISNIPTASASDENAIITSGMTITGDLDSTGAIDVAGMINGNVRCNGKLTVTGCINGNSSSSEFFADAAKVQGEVVSSGTVKIGVGSVVVGNIAATSAVIAGAVKGDIDVQGPVVVDTSAVVMGNIKSRSVQINNGAVIEGFCSQAYADVDVESVFSK